MTAEKAAPASTTSKKPAAPPSPERVARQIGWLDGMLIGLLLLFAFLLGSYASRNSDLWMHLATGRMIAQGEYSFGVDPCSYASSGTWINHSWLFDLLIYGLAQAAGGIETAAAGVVLVGFKSLLFVATAGVLLLIRRPGLSLWPVIVFTLLAILTASNALELRPRIFSLLFLAATLYLLVQARTQGLLPPREKGQRTAERPSPYSLWLLVPLFVLWANLDSWFLLGPITVGLFVLGEGFQQAFDPGRFGEDALRPGELRRLFQVWLACLAACVFNPHHLSGFAFPAEWAWGTREVLQQGEVSVLRTFSLWEGSYFRQGAPGRTVAGLAYYPLVLFGMLSFVLNPRGWRWWRIFLWIFFVLFSFGQASLAGLSAMVLAPVAAFNLQEFARSRFGLTPPTEAAGRAWSLGGRVLTALLVAVLLAGAWPGWLHGPPTDARHMHRVAWRVDVEPSLREAAKQLAAWRAEGRWPEGHHGFLYHPDLAHYCAWYAPGEKGFLDHRHALFSGTAVEFMRIRQALRGTLGKPPGTDARMQHPTLDSAYETSFRKQERPIRYLALYFGELDDEPREQDTQRQSVAARVQQWLLFHPERWAPIYLRGRAMIFAWREPRQPLPSDPTRAGFMDLDRRAFGPHPAEHDRAPAECPPWPTQRRHLGERYLLAEQHGTGNLSEASCWRDYYQTLGQFLPVAHDRASLISATASAAANAGAVRGSQLLPASAVFFAFFSQQFLNGESQGPPAASLLALRAARRAVATNPESARAYQELVFASELVWQQQEIPWNGGRFASPLREFAIMGAMRQMVNLRPDLHNFQMTLAELYFRRGHLDLAAYHLKEGLTLDRQRGARGGVTQEQFQKVVEARDKQLGQLEAEVLKRKNKYLVSAENQPPLEKAQIARQLGLTREALQVLMRPDGRDRDPNEFALLTDLLFATGQLHEVAELLQPRLKAVLGPTYDMHRALLSAVRGDYKEAAQYLDEMIAQASKSRQASFLDMLQSGTFLSRLGELPGGRIVGAGLSLEAQRQPKLAMLLQSTYVYQNALREEAFLHFLRGQIALEEGDNVAALRHLQDAVGLAGDVPLFDGLPVARRYLKLLQDARP